MADNMTYQDAYDYLITNIYAPVFFEKLAAYGVTPSSQEESIKLMELASKLQLVEESYNEKQAQVKTSKIGEVSNSLDRLLGIQHQNANQEVKAASAHLANDVYIRNAALLVQDAMRQAAAV